MNEKVETSCHGYLDSNIKNIHGMTIGNLLFHITIQQNPLSNLELQSIKITWTGEYANYGYFDIGTQI
jgi:hypothetical protein